MKCRYVGVRIIDMPYKADMTYTYFVPVTLADGVYKGRLVSVPLGVGNRRMTGVITEIYSDIPKTLKEHSDRVADPDAQENREPDASKAGKKKRAAAVKPVLVLFPEKCSLSEDILSVCEYVADRTLSPLGDVIRAAVPSELIDNTEVFYAVSERKMAPEPRQDIDMFSVYSYIKAGGAVKYRDLYLKFGGRVLKTIESLESSGYIVSSVEIYERARREKKCVRLALSDADLARLRDGTYTLRSQKQINFLKILDGGGGYMRLSEIYAADKTLCAAQLDSLVKQGAVTVEIPKDPFMSNDKGLTAPKIELKGEQCAAYSKLCELLSKDCAGAALLLGVTGSGKTAVIMKVIDRAISEGKGVIMLLPEIALTPQVMGLFRAYYGERVSLIHSALSDKDRLCAYEAIRDGRSDIVVGTRSAVFAPVKNLGMIVIDEEQEHTYKSDISPKYHARDVARYRCFASNALMVLMSATPSLESYQKALDGKYSLVTLTERYGNAVLPDVVLADMRREMAAGNIIPLGKDLVNALYETVNRGEQAVLFINRRGYNNHISCRTCGEVIVCPKCSVAMTYHKSADGDGYLCCHWCGKRLPEPKNCPTCGSEHLCYTGYGTQHIEEDLYKLIPGIRVLRMDTDAMENRQSYYEVLEKFRAHEADVLLGTQMVTKGHDFPNVTLVGVLLADASLYLDDYRAGERTFSMLTQVIGRAGRSDKHGAAIIQTNNPDNDIIRLAKAQDYFTFAKNELKLRYQLLFPPFCDIAVLGIAGSDETQVVKCAEKLEQKLESLLKSKYKGVKAVIFGPLEAPVYRVKEQYRMRIVVKCGLGKRERALFGELLSTYGGISRGPSLTVDFNPSSL